jgi:hypothetical protein
VKEIVIAYFIIQTYLPEESKENFCQGCLSLGRDSN